MENITFHTPMGIMERKEYKHFCNKKMDLTSFFNKLEACIIEVANNNLKNSYEEEGSFSHCNADMHRY